MSSKIAMTLVLVGFYGAFLWWVGFMFLNPLTYAEGMRWVWVFLGVAGLGAGIQSVLMIWRRRS